MRRRTFVQSAAAVPVLSLWPERVRGADDRLVLGVVGMGGRGVELALGFGELPGVEVKTVCDVDRTRAEAAAAKVGAAAGRAVAHASDFRTLLDDADVDAVAIATPNHWHAPATILACAAGKHVYCEKPCSHNPHEGELMVRAARAHGRLVQHGTQRRSRPGIVRGIGRLHEGAIGLVRYAHAYYRNRRPSIGVGKEVPPPPELDWELWQGPAPRRPYVDNLVHYDWHWRWHWGNGELGNNGVHMLDVARWGLGADLPEQVVSAGGRYWHPGDDQQTPDTQIASYRFPGGRQMTWEALSCNPQLPGADGEEVWFYGENGSARFGAAGCTLFDPAGKETETHEGTGGQREHLENFVAAVRGTAELNADVGVAHRSALVCHLGNIAQRTGRALACDPATGRIAGDDDAMTLWQRDYAPGWTPQA